MPLAINGHVSSSTTHENPKATASQMGRAANGSGARFGKWYLLSARLGYVDHRIYLSDLTRDYIVLEALVCTGLSAPLVREAKPTRTGSLDAKEDEECPRPSNGRKAEAPAVRCSPSHPGARVEGTDRGTASLHTAFVVNRSLAVLSIDFISGQSKNSADRAIADILEKRDVLKAKKLILARTRKALEQKAKAGDAQEIRACEAEVESVAEVITQLKGNISKQTSALGITEKNKLIKLKGNTFLRLRMNSLTLRQRIIQNLVARKFEMERFERLVRYGDRMGN